MSPALAAIVTVVVGLAVCFLGYRLFRILLPLAGLVYGYTLGVRLIGPQRWLLAVIIGVAAGVALALLSGLLWSVAVIIAAAVFGFGFGWTLVAAYLAPGTAPLVVAVLCAVIFAVLAALLRKPAIKLSTAAGGAGAAVYGLGLLIPSLGLHTRPNVVATVIIVVLAVAGFVVQLTAGGDREGGDREDGDRDPAEESGA